MRLKKIRLENIRSYAREEVVFPDSSVLLSGNIGSGKSTILLAVDFALFGITKDVPGGALLRNGAEKGCVELWFEIEGKEVMVRRNLKKNFSGVTQDAGCIILDGKRRDVTATELKQEVLNLLCYPQELLTKSKSLIYRYTVYTPQEAMKEILLAPKEGRLSILRRVFGIDKYKRIADNTSVFVQYVKGLVKEASGGAAHLEEKKRELVGVEQELRGVEQRVKEIGKIQDPLLVRVAHLKERVKSTEEKIRLVNALRVEFESVSTLLTHKEGLMKEYALVIARLQEEIQVLKAELGEVKEVGGSEEVLKGYEQSVREMEEKLREEGKKAEEQRTLMKSAKILVEKVTSMSQCPLCEQKVSDDHKKHIREAELKRMSDAEKKLAEVEERERGCEKRLGILRKECEVLRESLRKQEVVLLKKKNTEGKEKELALIMQANSKVKEEALELTTRKGALERELKQYKEVEAEYAKQKEELERVNEEERRCALERSSQEAVKRSLVEKREYVVKEVREKEVFIERMVKLKQLQVWLEECFIPMNQVMEKKMLLKVHHEFESLLQRWFGMLVDAEAMRVRLDEEFTPIIEQNGFEMEYNFLSGGEKTAAALSYRLALNQVINRMMSTIKTRDLLILDEPTDGFSQEQLERMRDILNELKSTQTIIVSHDSTIESFVDHVVRVQKVGSTSKVVG